MSKWPDLKKAAAYRCIESGLEFVGNSFRLTPVLLSDIAQDARFRRAKQACKAKGMPDVQLFETQPFQHLFTVEWDAQTVLINISAWIQNPSTLVKALLPTEAWTRSVNTSAAQDYPDNTSNSSSDSPTSTLEPRASLLSDSASDQSASSTLQADTPNSEAVPEPVTSMLPLLPSLVRAALQAHLTHAQPDM